MPMREMKFLVSSHHFIVGVHWYLTHWAVPHCCFFYVTAKVVVRLHGQTLSRGGRGS